MPSHLSLFLWTRPIILVSSLSLQTFLLDGNSLDVLPNELGSLQRLSYVGLSFNQFNHVPQVLEQLASMEKLCMAGNSLESLTLQNFRLLRVKHIDLRYGNDYVLLQIYIFKKPWLEDYDRGFLIVFWQACQGQASL